MSSSLSAMPFARQYGSFRATTTTNGTGTGSTTSSSSVAGGQLHHSRYSTGATEGGTAAAGSSHRVRLQMAPLSGYRLGNQANRTPTVSTSSSSSMSTSGSGNGSSSRPTKYPQQAATGGTKNQENIPTATGRSSAAVGSIAPATVGNGKLSTTTSQHSYNSSVERSCAVHHPRGGGGGMAGGTKKAGELIGDSPLLQSPRIIARSARIVEPNVWNRRLTASNFCSNPPVPASHHFQSSSSSSGNHHLPPTNGQRVTQAASLVCRKSPGSSGTSVESIVPKYTRTAQGATLSTVAQKRTYNAQKPQLRIVSSRTLANTSGRIGAGASSIASRKTGGTASSVGAGRSMTQGVPTAAREVAKVLQHHHHQSGAASMRVIDVLNNNHLQHQQPAPSYRTTGRAQAGENIENHHPPDPPRVEPATTNRSNGGLQKNLPSATKKHSGIPQRLPLTLATDQLQSGAAAFSSKFPNGLPFEQEFYYRRPPPAPAHRQEEEDEDEERLHGDEEELEGESDGQDVKMREENGSYMPDSWRNSSRKMKKVGSTTRAAVALGGGGAGRTQKEHHHQRNRSESTSEDNNTTTGAGSEDGRFVDFPSIYPTSGGGLQQHHRRHQTRHELELEKDKHKQQQHHHHQRKQEAGDGDGVVHSSGCPMTSVVEYRHINHSNYYYKFESVRNGAAKLGSKQQQQQHQHQQRKLLQRRPSQAAAAANGDNEEDDRASRRQRSTRFGAVDGNGNHKGDGFYADEGDVLLLHCNGSDADEHYDYDDEDDDDDDDDEVVDADGERSTVYVAVATWVPKCNRLPVEQLPDADRPICLTVSGGEKQQQLKQKQKLAVNNPPAAVVPSAVSRTAPQPVPAASVHGCK
ncbi:AGAP000847-PC-like protein [Anopheles sinensis]|uniref:AGAP000847-PC-like protein n=1 Tax=Anopheles sinensis TaxID=74873 RepID=A0A084WFC8_ANOSI|nr:AGAP000847-PC-like protein [Anopheles sinensis]